MSLLPRFLLFCLLLFSPVVSFAQTELIPERTYNQVVFDLGSGLKRYQIHTKHINYKDNEGHFQKIDTSLHFDEQTKEWKQSKASYHCKLPEYANGVFEFYNGFEGANHTLKAIPQAQHVKGVYYQDPDGSTYVLYPDAFGKGIDFKVYAYWAGLKKVIIIHQKPKDVTKDLTFDFELEVPSDANFKILNQDNLTWNKASNLDFKDKIIRLGANDKYTYFRNARVWDSAQLNLPVDIQLYLKDSKIYLKKTIKAELLQKATYPLYTDHPASYYAGAGDGRVGYGTSNVWATTHDAADGTYVAATDAVTITQSRHTGTVYDIARSFWPIDTSGIADTDTITAATLNLYVTALTNTDNDGDDWINVVQTSQADSATLGTADYDQCGAVTNPTEGATRIDLGSITTSAYNTWTLDATGLTWITKTGTTLLGTREGHDAINSAIADSTRDALNTSTSESTGTSQDPYLDVTVFSHSALIQDAFIQ